MLNIDKYRMSAENSTGCPIDTKCPFCGEKLFKVTYDGMVTCSNRECDLHLKRLDLKTIVDGVQMGQKRGFKMKYVLIGAAGFVAPRHMKAIQEVGGDLIGVLDPHDSVGTLDSYFPDCKYFREFERFDRFCINNDVDYCVVCSPNHYHDAHCLFGLRIGADVICEKPLVLNSRNLEQLREAEKEYDHRIWNILQLRLSDIVLHIKKNLPSRGQASIIYHTPRGDWYDYSWKSDISKSGGITFNIGIHLFDLLLWLFGRNWVVMNWECSNRKARGQFIIGNFTVYVDLSIEKGNKPERTLIVNDDSYELSGNFTDLHTLSYQKILDGKGFEINDTLPAIELCSKLRDFG